MKYILFALMLMAFGVKGQDTIIVYYKGDYKVPPSGTFWLSGPDDTRPTFKKDADCECELGRVAPGTYCDVCHGPCDNCNSCRCKKLGKKPCSTGLLVFGYVTSSQTIKIIPRPVTTK